MTVDQGGKMDRYQGIVALDRAGWWCGAPIFPAIGTDPDLVETGGGAADGARAGPIAGGPARS